MPAAGATALSLDTASISDLAQPLATLPPPTSTPPADETPDAGSTPTIEAEDGGTDAGLVDDGETASPETTAEPTATPTPTPPAVTESNLELASQFLDLLNQERTSRGLETLAYDSDIAGEASTYAAEMATGDFFGHQAPDGSSPESRFAASGYHGDYKGEALTAGHATAQAALSALLASPPHAAILLSPDATEAGIGQATRAGTQYAYYWVVVTGAP